MNIEIITALISGLSAIIVCTISNYSNSKKVESIITFRLQELEKKVEKHNNLIERTYILEKDVDLLEKEIEHIEKDLIHI